MGGVTVSWSLGVAPRKSQIRPRAAGRIASIPSASGSGLRRPIGQLGGKRFATHVFFLAPLSLCETTSPTPAVPVPVRVPLQILIASNSKTGHREQHHGGGGGSAMVLLKAVMMPRLSIDVWPQWL